jgi:hypothetical protein
MRQGFLIDLFGTVCNAHYDLARILSAIAFLGVNLLAIYRAYLGEVPTLSDYASANLQVLTGCAIFIGGKDIARSIATKGAE